MTAPRRKKARYTSRTRHQMKIKRDELSLEYLRTVRNLAKDEMRKRGEPVEPLSVYSTGYFPLSFQFKEKKISDGKTVYPYRQSHMPKWEDLTIRFKLEVFQLLCEEWDKCLYTFNPKIDPTLEAALVGRHFVTELRRRAKRRLDQLGRLPGHYAFVVEGHDRTGTQVGLHLHGMAVVENAKQADAVKLAMGEAAGQGIKGRKKMPSGNQGKFYYYEENKSWVGYITKNLSRKHPRIIGRKVVFSRPAVQITREFYNWITGQD